MKTTLALAAATLIACAAPALAQEAGAPGATGTGGGLTGSNTGSDYRYGQTYGDSLNPGPRPSYGYPNGQGGYLNEGRAAAPDYYGPDEGAPAGAWRSQTQNPGVGADLVGPGSGMNNPTDGHDVSR